MGQDTVIAQRTSTKVRFGRIALKIEGVTDKFEDEVFSYIFISNLNRIDEFSNHPVVKSLIRRVSESQGGS